MLKTANRLLWKTKRTRGHSPTNQSLPLASFSKPVLIEELHFDTTHTINTNTGPAVVLEQSIPHTVNYHSQTVSAPHHTVRQKVQCEEGSFTPYQISSLPPNLHFTPCNLHVSFPQSHQNSTLTCPMILTKSIPDLQRHLFKLLTMCV